MHSGPVLKVITRYLRETIPLTNISPMGTTIEYLFCDFQTLVFLKQVRIFFVSHPELHCVGTKATKVVFLKWVPGNRRQICRNP